MVTSTAASIGRHWISSSGGGGGSGGGGVGSGTAHARTPRTLSFEVCNGFANQRLALMYGLVIAKQLGRSPVLPKLIADGTQMTTADRTAANSAAVPFDAFYDPQPLAEALARHGLSVASSPAGEAGGSSAEGSGSSAEGSGSGGANTVRISLAKVQMISDVAWHFAAHHTADHIAVDCPLFRLSPGVIAAEKQFIWGMLAALRPVPALQQHVDAALARMGGEAFNFLHIRLERDWQAHCERWTALSAVDGIVRDNCFNNTLDVHKVLASMGFSTAAPLYVTAHWAGADPAASTAVVSGLLGAGYSVVKAGEHAALPREQQALVEFEVAMAAERFIGNSASTFSALAIAQRRHSGKWAAYYNGGDVPLARVVPLFDIPWVFTFNSWSAGYEPMLKAAVNSAARVGGIAPHCIYAGDAAAPVVAWMRAHGVRVIPHEPKWRAVLAELGRAHAAANLRQSHLFASEELIVGTWQRIDLPLVPWLDQYTYVLFTDTDVLFRRPIGFHEFPMPLPRAVGMGPEMVDMFPYNAGVMLAHLPRLRETYQDFLAFIMSNTNGLTFPGFGPGDQGAYNQFYEADVRAWRLPSKFNAKPYHAADPRRLSDAAIVHFHGPKPSDYLEYANTGACPKFGNMCRAGIDARACMYLHEWVRRLEGEDAKQAYDQWRSGCGARS